MKIIKFLDEDEIVKLTESLVSSDENRDFGAVSENFRNLKNKRIGKQN